MTTPSQPLGMADFFGLEAGEYLDRLDALLQAPGAPAADELVRLARALRGAALMASQQPIARAAMGLEALARGLREGRRPWDAATQQMAIRAVDDLRIFVRRVPAWTDADTAQAEALGSQLEQLGGRPSAQVRAAEALGLDAGARAFVAREGAAIGSALDRAARALRTNPLAHDPLQHVLKALQPLRGLAALNDLPPLPDLLEGIERVIGELERAGPGSPPQPADLMGELFQMAATAIAHAAREVAERGRPDPDSAEFRRFAGLLVRFMDGEPGVVPIESLGTVVQRGAAAGAGATLGRLELVSHGEHLRQAADSLERAPSATQRELRAHTLAGTFRALSAAGGGVLADRVAEFALAAREAVARGTAVSDPGGFAAELRRAGDILARSSEQSDEAAIATELAAVSAALRGEAAPVAPRAADAPPAHGSRLTAHAETDDIAGSWTRYERLVAAGVGPASLDELLARPSADTAAPVTTPAPRSVRPAPPAPPARPAAPASARQPVPTAPAAAEPAVVDIGALLYRGARARQRAQELRDAARRASGDDLRAIIDEVCDLVVLAIEPE